MAYPGNPYKGPAGFEKAPLTPDDFERLATAFRPSWELDEAPFTGAGSLSTADIRALQGGGTHVDVRATAQASLGIGGAHPPHAPPKPAVGHEEPANKVIIDAGIVPPPAAAQLVPPPPSFEPARPKVIPSPGPWAASQSAPPLGSSSSKVTTVRPPAPRARLDTGPALPPPGAKKGLWIGAGAAGLVLVGAIAWLTSGSPDRPVAAPIPTETAPEKVLPSIPPPPPEPVVVVAKPQAAPQPAAPPPPLIAATALPPAPNPQPAPTPPAAHAAAMPAPAPHPAAYQPPAPPAAPKPATASRPKGPTIVRDVPF